MKSGEAGEPTPWRYTALWATQVVAGIRGNDEGAKAELYARIWTGIRSYLRRQLPFHHVDDRAHDVFIITLTSIQAGKLKEPEKLPGYVLTIARRQVIDAISQMQHERANEVPLDAAPISDGRLGPEQELRSARRIELVTKAMGKLAPLDRDILVRWYLREQTTAEICSETGLTERQVCNRKHRAVHKLRAAVRGQMTPSRRLSERVREAC
jgi:RNA polymerase sigma factor (sigma-70 family)